MPSETVELSAQTLGVRVLATEPHEGGAGKKLQYVAAEHIPSNDEMALLKDQQV